MSPHAQMQGVREPCQALCPVSKLEMLTAKVTPPSTPRLLSSRQAGDNKSGLVRSTDFNHQNIEFSGCRGFSTSNQPAFIVSGIGRLPTSTNYGAVSTSVEPSQQIISHLPHDHSRQWWCVTQLEDALCLKIGNKDNGYLETPRWQHGSTFAYFIDCKSFPDKQAARDIEEAMPQGLSMWQGEGVRFKRVKNKEAATFQVKYDPVSYHDCVYATSFPPGSYNRALLVFELVFQPPNRDSLSNVLAHEPGHIVDLRHEFATETGNDDGTPAYVFGEKNPTSIMNRSRHVKHIRVPAQERMELTECYELEENSTKFRWRVRIYKVPHQEIPIAIKWVAIITWIASAALPCGYTLNYKSISATKSKGRN